MPSRLVSTVVAVLVRAIRALALVLQRRARLPALRGVLQHWAGEARTLRQGVLALSIGISITLVAGLVLGAMDRLLEDLPGLLILAPAAIGMRGAIFSALGGRLGTGMLTGQLGGRLTRRSFLGQNIEATALQSLITAVLLAAATRMMGAVTRNPTIPFTDLVLVSVIGAVLSSVAVTGVVLLLTRTAERQRWDMDAIGTPIISASADISTLPALVVGTYAVGHGVISLTLGWALVALALAATVAGLRNEGDLARRVVLESLPILLYTATMGVLAGTLLEARKEVLIASATLLVAVPPFLTSSGAIGGILSARLGSQLHLGVVEPTPLPGRPALLEGSISLLFAAMGYLAVAVLASAAAAALGYPGPGLLRMLAIIGLAGALAVVVVVAVGYYAATASFRFGLDPDNVGIPLVTSTMDFVGIGCLVVAITTVGV